MHGGLFQACKRMGISRSSWYLRRHITELNAVDFDLFSRELYVANANKMHIRAFNEICRKHLESPLLKGTYIDLQRNGALL